MDRLHRLTAGAIVTAITCLLTGGVALTQSAQPIRIGYGMALTGGLAAGGKQAALVYDIWAEEVNARGGLLGRKVEMIKYDDQSSPSTTTGIYTKLLDMFLRRPCMRGVNSAGLSDRQRDPQ
jgi:branched-chain amino acid transport system substrate-binding protein